MQYTFTTHSLPYLAVTPVEKKRQRFENEQKWVDSNKNLIDLFVGNIKEKIAEVLG